MAANRKLRPTSSANQNIQNPSDLIFRTPGTINTKYSVEIESDGQRRVFHLAGVRSPAEALWLALGEYFSDWHSQPAITEILVIGYSQTKKEREQRVAHADLYFPPLPTSK